MPSGLSAYFVFMLFVANVNTAWSVCEDELESRGVSCNMAIGWAQEISAALRPSTKRTSYRHIIVRTRLINVQRIEPLCTQLGQKVRFQCKLY